MSEGVGASLLECCCENVCIGRGNGGRGGAREMEGRKESPPRSLADCPSSVVLSCPQAPFS